MGNRSGRGAERAPETGSRGYGYSLPEIFAITFVLADVIVIAVALFAGPLYAVVLTVLLVASAFLVWFLARQASKRDREAEIGRSADRETSEDADSPAGTDPVTTLQRRYAEGELTEAEFERRLDRVLDANERAADADVDTADLELERSS